MGQTVIVTSRKFFSQLGNGSTFASNLSDFTTNLVGSAGEKVKIIQTVQVDWWSGATNGDQFYFIAAGQVQRLTGNFIDDGFAVGDTFDYNDAIVGAYTTLFSGTITALSADGLNMYYTVSSGTDQTGNTDVNRYFRGTTVLKSLLYNFGLIENLEPTNYISKVTNQEQGYTFKDLTVSTTGLNLNGYKGYETGSITCSTGVVSGYYQTFTITHILTIPFYNPTFEDNYLDGTIPTDYDGSNSLKYVSRCEFRAVFSNPNGSKIGVDDKNFGSVAFFNENFNGLQSLYTLDSIEYTDADAVVIAGIQKSGVTHVRAVVSGTISATHKFGIYVAKVTDTTVTNLASTFAENFLFDNVVGTVDDAVADSTIITNYTCIKFGTLYVTYEFNVEYTNDQQLLLEDGDTFIVGLQIGQGTLDNATSDKTTFMTGSMFGDYIVNSDEAGLLTWRDNRYYNHLQLYPDTSEDLVNSQHDFKGWIEDGLLNNFNFDLNLEVPVNKTVQLDSLKVEFIAYNTIENTYWVISSYTFNTSLGVVAPITQNSIIYQAHQFAIQTKRDFNLPIGDQFNLVLLETATALKGDAQLNYNAVCTFKVDWQKWIFNPQVDKSFYDASEPKNNLNQHSVNYYYGDWQLRFLYTAGVKTIEDTTLIENTTAYEFLSPRMVIKEYTEDGYTPPKFVGAITTHTEDGTQNIAGAILTNAKTLFKTVWTYNTATYGVMASAYADFVCIHRIEPSQYPASNEIEELSSLRFNLNEKLKPVAGVTLLNVVVGVSTITATCLIDNTQLVKGTNYKLSSRLFSSNALLGLAWEDINVHWEDINVDWEVL